MSRSLEVIDEAKKFVSNETWRFFKISRGNLLGAAFSFVRGDRRLMVYLIRFSRKMKFQLSKEI